jgi:hypothetical protein
MVLAQLPIQRVVGSLSLGVKWLGHEADHSCPHSGEVKNEWNYTSTSPYIFMAWCLFKDRNNFTLPLEIGTSKTQNKIIAGC